MKREQQFNTGKDMRRYEREHINEVWYGDNSVGPYLTINGKKQRTYIIALIDDTSRMIVGVDIFIHDNFVNLMSVMKSAVTRFGCPKMLGFGLITGCPGRGKTTAIRHYMKQVNPSLYKVTYTSLSALTVNDFYKHLAEQLGLESVFRKQDNFRNIQAEITRYSVEKRITPVFIIDEANYISNGILNDLKMLFNFEMDSRDRAVVLLVGLPQLHATLRLNANEPLHQRITMNVQIDSLKKEEAFSYIKTKLLEAKCTKNIFEQNALEAIANADEKKQWYGTLYVINKTETGYEVEITGRGSSFYAIIGSIKKSLEFEDSPPNPLTNLKKSI